MKPKIISILLLLIIAFSIVTLSGCWGQRDDNDNNVVDNNNDAVQDTDNSNDGVASTPSEPGDIANFRTEKSLFNINEVSGELVIYSYASLKEFEYYSNLRKDEYHPYFDIIVHTYIPTYFHNGIVFEHEWVKDCFIERVDENYYCEKKYFLYYPYVNTLAGTPVQSRQLSIPSEVFIGSVGLIRINLYSYKKKGDARQYISGSSFCYKKISEDQIKLFDSYEDIG